MAPEVVLTTIETEEVSRAVPDREPNFPQSCTSDSVNTHVLEPARQFSTLRDFAQESRNSRESMTNEIIRFTGADMKTRVPVLRY